MEDKYYVPELEEFHDKFEYETLDLDWKKSIFDFRDLEIIDDQIREGVIRVKHLDRQDIEECGWKQIEYDSFALGDFILEFNPEHYTYIYLKIYTKDVRFKGTIKNISELRRIMKQLNIE